MPGMSTGLSADNSTIVSAFQSALVHQGLIALGIVVLVFIAWNALRAVQLRRTLLLASGGRLIERAVRAPSAEPVARRLLRIAFGFLWIFDGILQGQTAMPLGLTSQVIGPSAATSPEWVRHLVNAGATIWNLHPVTAAAATVWIQIGVGLLLLVAPRGYWSRCAGLASAAWGLIVWIFGEAFGAIFAPGLSWLTGAPGGVLFYVAAGLIVAVSDDAWRARRLGRSMLAVMGTFFIGMALLQAWPGRGSWQGTLAHHGGVAPLTAMVRSMAATPQPALLSSWVSSFGSFVAAHGFAVNLFVVIALGALGLVLLTGRLALVRVAVAGAVVFCLATWVLVQDFGFFGGLGTDPNSMIPMAILVVGGYVAMARLPAAVADVVHEVDVAPRSTLRERISANPTAAFRTVAAIGALAIVLIGAAPMAVASVNGQADPIISEATDGTPSATDTPAPPFRLVDQSDKAISLASLSGKAIALTFLDPVCTNDCPVIAQEFKEADIGLGASARRVEFIAVVANPLYRSVAVVRAFDRAEDLTHLSNWLFLTGSVAQLEKTWAAYGVQVEVESAGAMVAHADQANVIDTRGHLRDTIDADPGPGTAASKSSFATVLDDALRKVLGPT